MALIKEILNLGKIKMFSGAGYTQNADICFCPSCNSNIFVPTGMDYCPLCGEELQWNEELSKKGIYDVNNLSEYVKHPDLIEFADRQCWDNYK